MNIREANRRAAELLAAAIEEEEQSGVAYADGAEARASRLMARALLHSSLATTIMLVYGTVYVQEIGE